MTKPGIAAAEKEDSGEDCCGASFCQTPEEVAEAAGAAREEALGAAAQEASEASAAVTSEEAAEAQNGKKTEGVSLEF